MVSGAAERRIVTVLFCDVAGSTAMAEQLDPEEWVEIMDDAYDYLIPPVHRYGGTVTRLLGDAILAFFGAPVAHEDDPRRAIMAGLDILTEIRPFRERIRHEYGFNFDIRVGINTGTVVAGEIGSGETVEYTAMGDAVNLAARMEQTARPGTIQIAHATYRLAAPFVEVEPLGQIDVKGKRDPVPAYRVLGLKAQPARLPGPDGMSSSLIGRTAELNLLHTGLDRLLAGQGQIVCLIGEAGLGKSRLVYELKESKPSGWKVDEALDGSGNGLVWYEAESLSFEAAQPYGLIQRLLRRVCGIRQDDPPTLIRDKMGRLLGALTPEEKLPFARAVATLFGLDPDDTPPQPQGEDLKQDLIAGMLALVKAWTNMGPTTLVFEDLHWADPASVELISRMLPLVDEVPLFLMCVLRPDHQSEAWKLKEMAETDWAHRYLGVELQPLTSQESHALVGNLLIGPDLPEKVGALVLEKAQGVPFFVEELVRELVESGAVIPSGDGQGWRLVSEVDDIDLPDNLEAVLVARMDRLKESVRRTLQLAAVIGRTFYYRVLRLIAEGIDQLDQHLQTLQQVGMIQEAGQIPELEYMFRHVLTQEAAYNTILHRRRRRYHQQTGEVMERLFADRLDEHASLLAHHFHAAGDLSRALRYYALAAASAARLYANHEAVAHYSQAIELARQLSPNEESLAALHQGRGLAYETLGEFDRARADHETSLQIAREAGKPRGEWKATLELGKLWASRDYERTGYYFEQALELARQMGDPLDLARSLNQMGNWYTNAEEPQIAIEHHQEALEILERVGDQRALADTLDLLGMANALRGDYGKSRAALDKAISIFRELGDRHRLASSLLTRGLGVPVFDHHIFVLDKTFEEGMRDVIEALEITQETGWRALEAFAHWCLSMHQVVAGQYGSALETIQRGLDIALEIGHRQWTCGSLFALGMLHCDFLDGEAARARLIEALALAREIRSQYWIHVATAGLAKAYLLMEDQAAAQACLEAVLKTELGMDTIAKRFCWGTRAELALVQGEPELALRIAEQLIVSVPGMTPEKVISANWKLRGEALAALGRADEAVLLLRKAIENSEVTGERHLLWRLHVSLGRVLRSLNREAEAEVEFSIARVLIEEMASSLADRELREGFRQRAEDRLRAAGPWQPFHF